MARKKLLIIDLDETLFKCYKFATDLKPETSSLTDLKRKALYFNRDNNAIGSEYFYDGGVDLIKKAIENGVKIALITNNDQELAIPSFFRLLEKSGLPLHYIKKIATAGLNSASIKEYGEDLYNFQGSDDDWKQFYGNSRRLKESHVHIADKYGKPKLSMYIQACAKLGLSPKDPSLEVTVIGDQVYSDIQFAANISSELGVRCNAIRVTMSFEPALKHQMQQEFCEWMLSDRSNLPMPDQVGTLQEAAEILQEKGWLIEENQHFRNLIERQRTRLSRSNSSPFL